MSCDLNPRSIIVATIEGRANPFRPPISSTASAAFKSARARARARGGARAWSQRTKVQQMDGERAAHGATPARAKPLCRARATPPFLLSLLFQPGQRHRHIVSHPATPMTPMSCLLNRRAGTIELRAPRSRLAGRQGSRFLRTNRELFLHLHRAPVRPFDFYYQFITVLLPPLPGV